MLQPILSVNSGSSSLKFALYGEERLLYGAVEGIGQSIGRLWIKDADDGVLAEVQRDFPRHSAAAAGISDAMRSLSFPKPAAAGHRVVHGGPHHSGPEPVDYLLIAELRKFIPFAPLHLPSAIRAIEAVAERFPGLPQVACFDTAFHRRMPQVAQRFPLPRDLWDEGIRRYGFHGLSFEYIVTMLGADAGRRVVIAHLGNGASLAALRDRKPIDTTMGFTPSGGLMMGTRSGDIDPGVLIYLMHQRGYDADGLDELVNQRSGLLGVSGITSDMKLLLERRQREPSAAQAVELFCYQIQKHIGAMAAVIGGLDSLIFTGGIGERAPLVRWEICQGLDFLGIRLDAQNNALNENVISNSESACSVRVIPTNEDSMIVRHTRSILFPVVKS